MYIEYLKNLLSQNSLRPCFNGFDFFFQCIHSIKIERAQIG